MNELISIPTHVLTVCVTRARRAQLHGIAVTLSELESQTRMLTTSRWLACVALLLLRRAARPGRYHMMVPDRGRIPIRVVEKCGTEGGRLSSHRGRRGSPGRIRSFTVWSRCRGVIVLRPSRTLNAEPGGTMRVPRLCEGNGNHE